MAKKSRAERKKETEKKLNGTASTETKVTEKKDNNKEKKTQATYEPQPAPKLTIYTVSAMLALLAAATATIMSMVMMAKPVSYVVDAYYGAVADLYWLDALQNYVFSEGAQSHITKMFTLIAVLIIVATILTLIDVVKTLNPKNKPALLLSVIAFAVSIGAVIVYIQTYGYADERFELSVYEYDPYFGIYKVLFIGLVVNAVFMLINVIGNSIGYSKWKKTRKTY